MDLSIAAILAQDGITSGAIYALLALGLVLVFSVTRVILIPQGEFVSYGALTLAAIQAQKFPSTCWLLLALGFASFVVELASMFGQRGDARSRRRIIWGAVLRDVAFPLAVCGLSHLLASRADLPLWAQIALTLLIVVPIGPYLYRLAFERIAQASTLVLLIVAVAAHLALVGLGLLMFGAEGSRTTSLTDANFSLGGGLTVSGQSLSVVVTALVMIVALYLFFGRTLTGKALRATSISRLGAQLVGIAPAKAGRIAFTLAAALGVLSGVLVSPLTTLYYDGGFLIGLKGFVGAIIGGLVSYPVAAAGALLVGLLESYSSFWASAYKEVIVFALIVPVLLWRSLSSAPVEETDE
jgi:branched-chain amino acid transport system permease protein